MTMSVGLIKNSHFRQNGCTKLHFVPNKFVCEGCYHAQSLRYLQQIFYKSETLEDSFVLVIITVSDRLDFRPTARPSRQARDDQGGAVKRELCVVNRTFFLLLLACFFVTHASCLAAQPWFDANDENKAKDGNAAKDNNAATTTAAKDGSNAPTNNTAAVTTAKDGGNAGKDANALKSANDAKDESK